MTWADFVHAAGHAPATLRLRRAEPDLAAAGGVRIAYSSVMLARPLVFISDEMTEVLREMETETKLVRVHGCRVDHTARQERPGRWSMTCGALPVNPEDFERSLCGTPCLACDRVLRLAADPAGVAMRAHTATVRRRKTSAAPGPRWVSTTVASSRPSSER